jgi:putative FmdB family regulatory protein
MPTYAYRCSRGHEFEEFQKMTDPPGATCPVCGEPAQRVITGGGGFLLKGQGFYATDYRSESYKKAAKAESPKASDQGAGTAPAAEKSGVGAGEGRGEAGGTSATRGDKTAPKGRAGGTGAAGRTGSGARESGAAPKPSSDRPETGRSSSGGETGGTSGPSSPKGGEGEA